MRGSVSRLAPIALAVALAVPARGAIQERPAAPLSRVIGLNLTLERPPGTCTVPSLIFAIAKDLRVPAGAERLPGPCQAARPDEIAERIPLLGQTVQAALDLMAKFDPRYRAVETDGVIVVRPLAAWAEKDHFLHTMIEHLDLQNDNIGAALSAVLTPFRPNSGNAALLMSGAGRITLSLGPLSVIDALDAIVRAHGAARWQISYCLPEMSADVANAYLQTYEDQGIGGPVAPQRRGADGTVIRCPPM